MIHHTCFYVKGLSVALVAVGILHCTPALAGDYAQPETVIRQLLQANANKDMDTLATLMALDQGSPNYTLYGQRFTDWDSFEKAMKTEFNSASDIDINIRDLQIHPKDTLVWFTLEIDYVRQTQKGREVISEVIPMRETGILEKRKGQWRLVHWHESADLKNSELPESTERTHDALKDITPADLSGTWLIMEEDKSYIGCLSDSGKGHYLYAGGKIEFTSTENKTLTGVWHQSANDREGGFEIQLMPNSSQAMGQWWYTRVGGIDNIPPKAQGGPFKWVRLNNMQNVTKICEYKQPE